MTTTALPHPAGHDLDATASPRVLVLGGSGMLGHKLCQVLGTRFDVRATVRTSERAVARLGVPDPARTVADVSADRFDTVVRAVATVRPDVVVNCIGIVKQAREARDPIVSISINSLFPHRVAELCRAAGARLIHVSTDCVFSGRAGGYVESDVPDPVDLYGRSKLLGEVEGAGCLTVRTSIIGRELSGANGLIEWFLGQEGSVRGFRRAIFSGLTTQALARVLASLVCDHGALTGIRHVSSEPISKYDLLCLLKDAYGLGVEIVPDDDVACDRSLDGTKFEQETGLRAPSWAEMVAELAADETPYERMRS
ncbi:MAG: SDR family oxidoreductase [Actinomycetota bacterium]|nr:SDR family oxidoreductase [Actinomycetota bacterium]